MCPPGSTPSSCSGSPIRRKAIVGVENYAVATSQIAQTTLRSLLGRADLDTLLAHREGPQPTTCGAIIEKADRSVGCARCSVVEIKDVEIPESMQRAMAREAEAERERRAKVINARGELAGLRRTAAGRGDVVEDAWPRCNCATCRHLLELGRRPELDCRVPAYQSISSPRF